MRASSSNSWAVYPSGVEQAGGVGGAVAGKQHPPTTEVEVLRRAPLTAGPRVLERAGYLLYTEGITATGVDRVAALASVSKPMLNKHFGSKPRPTAELLQ